jgi:hypothetical protein
VASHFQETYEFKKLNNFTARCITAVRKEWSNVEELFLFLLRDNQDDPSAKLAALEKIADLQICLICSPPQVRIYKICSVQGEIG